MVKDSEMKDKFWTILMEICENENLRKEMSKNLSYFAKPYATKEIVDKILEETRGEQIIQIYLIVLKKVNIKELVDFTES